MVMIVLFLSLQIKNSTRSLEILNFSDWTFESSSALGDVSNGRRSIFIYSGDRQPCCSSDGVVVRASASQSVDLGFIPLVESYHKT